MASVMTGERKNATLALMKHLRNLKTGKVQNAPGQIVDERPIVLALDYELMWDVISRLHGHRPPVVLAVYYVETGNVVLAEITLTDRTPDTLTVGRELTVGMAIDSQSMAMADTWETLQVRQVTGRQSR